MTYASEPIAPCCFCGTDPAPFLYTTPVCVTCAKASRLAFQVATDRTGLALLHTDGRRHWISWSESDTPSLRNHYTTELAAREERFALIAAGLASEEDPAFLANIGDYIAQVGWNPSVERALAHQRDAAKADGAVAEAERIMGLRS